jgi:CDP-diacylglycerol--glycerol-3-phosphate 3-phosphatidyltransferase
VAAYLVPAAFGFLKFRRLTSYHTWISKFSALLVPVGLLSLFADGPAWPFHIAIGVFAFSGIEEIIITAILSQWQANVPSVWHAVEMARPSHRPKPKEPEPAVNCGERDQR